ncbi:MAG: phosphotransferase [Pseudomonadales bacterium]|nr:phosphotransferase [Pseudomonadales bacterium]
MTFPVSHSTLDAQALARAVAERYDLGPPQSCRLISRGSNDLYALQFSDQRRVLRVARANHRSASEATFELELLRHLAGGGMPVPAPIPLADGSLHFSVVAPEGERRIVLQTWVEGRALDHSLSPQDARAAGMLLARLHERAHGFRSAEPKLIDTVGRIERKLSYVDALLPLGTAGRDLFDQGFAVVQQWFAAGSGHGLPRGPTHGDFQYANLMQSAGGALAAVDFDDCGIDCLAMDIVTFAWRSRFDDLAAEIDAQFLAGYQVVRPLADAERAALPMLLLARDLYLHASYAAYIDRIGPVSGFEDEARFMVVLARDLHALGIT